MAKKKPGSRKKAAPKRRSPASKKKNARPAHRARPAKNAEPLAARPHPSGVRFDDWVQLVESIARAATEAQAMALYQPSLKWPYPFLFLELAGEDETETARLMAAHSRMNERIQESREHRPWAVFGHLSDAINTT
jgi:hypothetical protein